MRVRVVDMSHVDVGLFEFDFDSTFSTFILNHEEQIYLRYGVRGDRSPTEYLSQKGLIHTLETGLELHQRWKAGELPKIPRPKPKPATSYPAIQRLVKKGECVHCHHVADARARELLARPGFDRKRDIWIFPETERLGMTFDIDQGLVLAKASDAAEAAGLAKGDRITAIGDANVHTLADIQRVLDRLPVDAKQVEVMSARKVGEKREESKRTVSLPDYWRVTDINWRNIGHRLEPFPGFWSRALTADEKGARGLERDGFASEVTKFWVKTPGQRAGLRKGDVVYEVNGVRSNPLSLNVMIYIRLHHKTGETIDLKFLRGEERLTARFRLRARPW